MHTHPPPIRNFKVNMVGWGEGDNIDWEGRTIFGEIFCIPPPVNVGSETKYYGVEDDFGGCGGTRENNVVY